VGRLICTPHPRSRMRPPPVQHAPVRACTRCRIHPRPDMCPHRNGYVRIAFRPREDTVFALDPTRPRPLTRVCARYICAHSRGRVKNLCPAPRVHAWSPSPFPPVPARRICARICGCAKNPRPAPRVRAWSPRPFSPLCARSHPPAPVLTTLRPVPPARAH
jgi:hypothetical protein